ncbi:hypothetical protein [Domibacillus enclensis]|uniref:Uncharacterized protein n=1 Tax=Domibacillus enclensis TaxID=1017273 RepID=A0ABX4ECT1_9BACI|nr:hypothetical protein [Domibacillus enclensis]OXS80228.1 hypothetical protein B1B05_01770 [Domibacillus enclensis]
MTYLDSRFHACATCRQFQAFKGPEKMIYRCRRLGFETNPGYRFDCWDPKDQVKKLMDKEREAQHDK